jgi:hypothetical protein
MGISSSFEKLEPFCCATPALLLLNAVPHCQGSQHTCSISQQQKIQVPLRLIGHAVAQQVTDWTSAEELLYC